jgi:iron complex transport system substrate-binding protein
VWLYFSLCSNSAFCECLRIVPLSPVATEIIFDMGLGDKVVATSSFTKYPTEADSLPKLGGLLDPNIELLLSLRPNLVILLPSQQALMPVIKRAKIATVFIEEGSIDKIIEAYGIIGQFCALEAQAKVSSQLLSARMKVAVDKFSLKKKLDVLVLVGSLISQGDLTPLYISGRDGIYTSLLESIGANNPITGYTSSFSSLSSETIYKIRPDAIIQIAPPGTDTQDQKLKWRSDLNRLFNSSRDIPILIIADDFASIPGPRMVQLLEVIGRFLLRVTDSPNS